MKKLLGFCLGIVISIGLSPPAVSASTSSDLQVNISEVISLSITSTCDNTAIAGNDVSLSLTPNSSGVLSSCPNIVTVSTNTPGFQLSLKSNSSNLVNTTNNSLTIASTTNTTANSLLANSWGYALPASSTTNHDIVGIPASLLTNFNNSYTTRSNTTPLPNDKYLKPPTTDTTIKDLTSSLGLTTNLVNNQTTIYYAVTADMTTRAGAYSTPLTYTAIGEVIPEPPPTMQGFDLAECQAMPMYDSLNPDPASTIILTDIRNDQEYSVRRLQDGNCWMIDNLKLELGVIDINPTKDTTVLEPSNTNVATNTYIYFTNDSTATGTPLGGMTGNFTTSGYLNIDGANNLSGFNSDAWRQADPSNLAHCLYPSGSAYTGTNTKTGCGFFYNWYTSTASSSPAANYGTAPNLAGYKAPSSICPANWRLPTGGSGGDFSQLDITYGGDGTNQSAPSNPPIQIAALWFSGDVWHSTLSGLYQNDANFGSVGSMNFYWSSSIMARNAAYIMYVADYYVYPRGTMNKHQGAALRCIVGS